jgi:D-alanyl-D-alanine carboxypeptidase (penicillin-binding protein 5/6)
MPEDTPKHVDEPEHFVTNEELLSAHPHTSPVPVLPQLSVALGLLVFVFGVTYIGASSVLTKSQASDIHIEATPATSTVDPVPLSHIFEDTEIEARSAIVWDVQTQRVLFNKNADDQRPLASITKLMTALVAYELLDPEDTVAISKRALQAEGNSGLNEGETFTMQNLADLTLIESSNDGATALGARAGSTVLPNEDPNAVFVQAMNLKAEELGLTKTYFKNSTGLDISETQAGAYGSARDVALLMEYIITNVTDAVALTNTDVTTINNKNGDYHLVKNTNEVVNDIDGLIASKTGYTLLSGGNLVVAVNVGLNRPVVVAVLGSSYDGRFADTMELIERARLYIDKESE